MSLPGQILLKKLRLCAELANYAYASGNPELTEAQRQRVWPAAYRLDPPGPHLFFSYSWFVKPEWQHWSYKSHGYVCKLESKDATDDDGVNRIVVGIRGTFLQQRSIWTTTQVDAPNRSIYQRWTTQVTGLFTALFGPRNCGLADIAYDITLIRVPYRDGVVWKWFTYWGTLVLEGSDWLQRLGCFGGPRSVAAGLMSRPYGNQMRDTDNRLVHLGFWGLWASPEGLGGYDRSGHLWIDQEVGSASQQNIPLDSRVPVRPGILQTVLKMIDSTKRNEILVVGHSLGGAVSCFAALSLLSELEKHVPTAHTDIFHATFGAPAVGTEYFAQQFKTRMAAHQSYAILHERDIVAKCFAFANSNGWTFWLGWFGWWRDWSRVGEQKVLRRLGTPAPAVLPARYSPLKRLYDRIVTVIDHTKLRFVAIAAAGFLIISALSTVFSIIVAPICKAMDRQYYRRQRAPGPDWRSVQNQGAGQSTATQVANGVANVSVEYHYMAKYIELLQDDDPF